MSSSRTSFGVDRRPSSSSAQPATYKFPELSQEALHLQNEHAVADSSLPSTNRLHSAERWPPRKTSNFNVSFREDGVSRAGATRHGRQKSLSEAIRTVRTRKGSVSQNAHEIAEALKAPVSARLVVRRQYRSLHFQT